MNGFAPSVDGSRRGPSLLLALTTTSILVLVPLGAAWAAQILAPAHDLLVSIVAGMLVSLALTWLATKLWERTTRAGERVFGDVTMLGYWRYERAKRQVAKLETVMAEHQTITCDEARRTMVLLAEALERRDLRTHGHSRRVARHAAAIAREMGLEAEDVARIRFAAAMHDIGKLNVPAEILFKPDKLTKEEFDIIKQHPVDSAKMVEVIDDPELIAIIRGHHERWDGGGYPDNLAGVEIPLGARIISVADTFDAMVSDRPYSGAAAHKKSREIIAANAGAQFDPQVADAFRQYYRGGNWHVAWGALSALPPRMATLLGDLLRGGIPAVGAAPALAAIAIAAIGVAGVGALPGVSGSEKSDQLATSAAAGVVDESGGRAVTLKDGRTVRLPDGIRIDSNGVAVDSNGRPVDLTHLGAPDAPSTGSASDANGAGAESGSGSAPGDKPSGSGGDSQGGNGGSSDSGNNVGDTVKDTTTNTTDTVGETVKGVGDTVGAVGETVKNVGDGELTDTVGETVKNVGGTVTEVGETVKQTGGVVGGVVGGVLGGSK